MIFRFGTELMKKYANVIYNYYLSKFKKIPKSYYIRGYGENKKDLKDFCSESMNDPVLKKLVKDMGWCYQLDHDRLVIDILRFVWGRTRYIGDHLAWNVPEYWQTARQTYDLKRGDCEDGAILLLTLCRLAGVPSNKIFLQCGYMKNGGGHAYVKYFGNNGVRYFLDWSYYYDKRRIPNHKTIDDKRYGAVWWFGNDRGFYI